MGFSVSGATALVFIAAFISLGILSTAATNGYEQVNDAHRFDTNHALRRQNTDIAIVNASCTSTLDLWMENTGTSSLHPTDTDVLVDNVFQSNVTYSVDGNVTTDLWLPGETLHVTEPLPSGGSRVKVVSGPGVAVAGGC